MNMYKYPIPDYLPFPFQINLFKYYEYPKFVLRKRYSTETTCMPLHTKQNDTFKRKCTQFAQ